MNHQLWLIRHGETAWTLSGAHTGRTDIPLTPNGEQHAREIAKKLDGQSFSLVLTSPLQRACETCRLAGYGDMAQIDEGLKEWDYGDYEGLTTSEIRLKRPDWQLWRDGVPGGETVDQVGERAERVIARANQAGGDVALFAHGHLLRILSACWLGLAPDAGRLFSLNPASISTLGYERETRVISLWNLT